MNPHVPGHPGRRLTAVLVAGVGLAFLAIPLVSVLAVSGLATAIAESERQSVGMTACLEMLSRLDEISLSQARLVRSSKDLLLTRDELLLDGEAYASMTREAGTIRSVLAQLHPRLDTASDSAELLIKLNLEELPALIRDRKARMVTADDRFRDIESQAGTELARMRAGMEYLTSHHEGISERFHDMIGFFLAIELNYQRLLLQKQANYLDSSVARVFQRRPTLGSEEPETGMSEGQRNWVRTFEQSSASLYRLVNQRLLPALADWINTKGTIETGFSILDARVDESAERLGMELHQASLTLRGQLDDYTESLRRIRQEVQTSLNFTSAVTIVIALGLAGMIVAVFVWQSRTNRRLSLVVAERTAELSTANADLQDKLSELQQTQEHLIRIEKLASLGSLVAGIAHEINTPLGVALTAATYQTDRLKKMQTPDPAAASQPPSYDPAILDANSLIVRNLERAASLIRSFKQVSVDQTHGDVRDILLAQYANDVFLSLSPYFRDKRIVLDNRIGPTVAIRCHAGALSQILTNLFMNARIHAFADRPDGCIILNAEPEGERLRFSFQDDGAGMADEVAAHAFDPFFTTLKNKGGTGLGLFIIHNLVFQSLGGNISLESGPGLGATFRIDLPRTPPEIKPSS